VESKFQKSKFYPLKLDLRISGFSFSGTSGYFWYFWYTNFLVFWYFVKLEFHFAEDPATEKVHSRCQIDPWGRAQLSRRLGS
jgi:hypothetical protein